VRQLSEIGLDSLMGVELGASLQERFGLEAPPAGASSGSWLFCSTRAWNGSRAAASTDPPPWRWARLSTAAALSSTGAATPPTPPAAARPSPDS
jgi:hypothetical protein